ncbi:MAG: glycoside hydrolase family 25 protein [Bacilli bacterium]|nr:glycoside hydrolase family 25 protein [Bacilli bacterium]
MRKGIDVSSYQGRIDWAQVKPYIDFAILRCGYGNDIRSQDDVYFERNATLCKELGIPFGVYLFSYATNLDEARSEVEHTLRLIRDKKLEYPVFLDVESKRQMALPKEELVNIVKYYCEEMERAGYYVGIYASLDRFRSNLDSKELDPFDKWVAEWGDRLTYNGRAGMWQNTDYEEIPGINGRVDGDEAFYDYPRIIRDAGLNHLDDTLKYKKGDRLYFSGDVYEDSDATVIRMRLCDEEVTILEIDVEKSAPYRIEQGYVKEEDLYKKCS